MFKGFAWNSWTSCRSKLLNVSIIFKPVISPLETFLIRRICLGCTLKFLLHLDYTLNFILQKTQCFFLPNYYRNETEFYINNTNKIKKSTVVLLSLSFFCFKHWNARCNSTEFIYFTFFLCQIYCFLLSSFTRRLSLTPFSFKSTN
jgi:hypothetical protein